jgi:hypothetical protein
LRPLRQEVRRDLLTEGQEHKARKLRYPHVSRFASPWDDLRCAVLRPHTLSFRPETLASAGSFFASVLRVITLSCSHLVPICRVHRRIRVQSHGSHLSQTLRNVLTNLIFEGVMH